MKSAGVQSIHYLAWDTSQKRTVHKSTDAVVLRWSEKDRCFNPDALHAAADAKSTFSVCSFAEHGTPHSKAIILNVRIEYTMNESTAIVPFVTVPLFDGVGGSDEDRRTYHPDSTGRLSFAVTPGPHSGQIPDDEQEIYRPNFMNLSDVPILHYAGLEEHICSNQSVEVVRTERGRTDGSRVCRPGDPILGLLASYGPALKIPTNSMRIIHTPDNATLMCVTADAVKKVTTWFKKSVMPHYRYTRLRELTFYLDVEPGEAYDAFAETMRDGQLLSMRFVTEYFIIEPRMPVEKITYIDISKLAI